MKTKEKLNYPDWNTFCAVWDYIEEHSDITQNGTLFIKFHSSGFKEFYGRINSRMNGYHRKNEGRKVVNYKKNEVCGHKLKPITCIVCRLRARLLHYVLSVITKKIVYYQRKFL